MSSIRTEFACGPGIAEVMTENGMLRGYIKEDIYHFLGVRYGTAKRFLPAAPETPWEGCRTATDYGYVCPNPLLKFGLRDTLLSSPVLWPDSEDCLNLNIWTGSLDPDAKKPVMFWIHGGAFSSGNAIHLAVYEGHNTAKYGDVVCVSVNHRLGALAYMNLSGYGEEYADSGNLGLLDLVLALKWVKNNISAFGGDPDNVTIYGHSGGGGKISALMQMPAADGLYHKVIMQSGLIQNEHLKWPTPEESAEWAEKLAKAAGGVDRLSEMPVDEMMELCTRTYDNQMFWLPTQGAGTFIGDHTVAGLRKETACIPVILGSALNEFGQRIDFVDKSALSDEQKLEMLKEVYGPAAEGVKREFEKAYPGVNSCYAKNLDHYNFRPLIVNYSRMRAEMNAPTYQYMLTYELALGGGYMSYHGAELPFTFHNVPLQPAVINGEKTWRFQDEIFNAWMQFVRTGDPNHNKLPECWRPYTESDHACMVFGDSTECRADHDADLMAYMKSISRIPTWSEIHSQS